MVRISQIDKRRINAGLDILRIHAFWQFYRYKMNITRFFRLWIAQ